MPMAHYVGLQGHDDFSLSRLLLKELTKRFSSEHPRLGKFIANTAYDIGAGVNVPFF